MFKRWLLIFGMLLSSIILKAQEIELANEYFKQGEYEKAKELFEKISRDKNNARLIHRNYVDCLFKLRNFEDAEKFLKKQIKNNETAATYKADYAQLLELLGKTDQSKQMTDALINDVARTDDGIYELQDYYYQKGSLDLVIQLLLKGRELQKSPDKFAIFLARAYLYNGQKENMLDEILTYGLKEGNIEYVKATIQDNLKEDKEIDMLEKTLYKRIQANPNEIFYSELIIWHQIQQKNFYKAFLQSKALDKKLKLEGQKVFELASIAFKNKDYRNAILMYDYVMKEYPAGEYYPFARRWIIQCKEELVKATYPINKDEIRSLIVEYDKLIQDVGLNAKTLEAVRNKAILKAFYLDENQEAIKILEDLIASKFIDNNFKDRCKIDLGDIYLLKDEPWEATLLYSQVEKSNKEDYLGEEAKLKNAKLHYYNAEFDLAKELLDILKKATTREIANDAMELSLLIQDNTGMDTTEQAMKEYAAMELLVYQNKNEEALVKIDTIAAKYKSHSLADEILWKKANIELKLNQYENALVDLEAITKNYSTDILADDAYFLEGKIIEEKLNQKEKAMAIYRDILQKYPGSIYGAEARKRYRQLRGDYIN